MGSESSRIPIPTHETRSGRRVCGETPIHLCPGCHGERSGRLSRRGAQGSPSCSPCILGPASLWGPQTDPKRAHRLPTRGSQGGPACPSPTISSLGYLNSPGGQQGELPLSNREVEAQLGLCKGLSFFLSSSLGCPQSSPFSQPRPQGLWSHSSSVIVLPPVPFLHLHCPLCPASLFHSPHLCHQSL